MNLSNLKRASHWEIEEWLKKELNLSPYQISKLSHDELIRFSPFYFYKAKTQRKVNILWRLSVVFYPIYWVLAVVFLPIRWIAKGEWGYGRNFIDKFHRPWLNKIGL